MVRETQDSSMPSRRCLVVGNYCHDVLLRDDVVIGRSLGGAVSFIAAVLDGLSIASDYVCKVGPDFAYDVNHQPLVSSSSTTTVFHAHFLSEIPEITRQDRILKRVRTCDQISPSDLPESKYDFGMAVGVAGEILPETLEKMLDSCRLVYVDIQALIRVFDAVDGTVNLIRLKDSGFFHLLPRIGVLKASADEAPYMDVDEAKKLCCVVVTNGKDGCTVYWKDIELQISPFPTVQVDPTGAGDSFIGGFVAGLANGLTVPDAALLGNFFGSLTVSQIGLPKFDSKMLQKVKDEVQRRKTQCIGCHEKQTKELNYTVPLGHEQFHSSLGSTKINTSFPTQECKSPKAMEQQQGILCQCNGHQKLLISSVYEEPIKSVDTKP